MWSKMSTLNTKFSKELAVLWFGQRHTSRARNGRNKTAKRARERPHARLLVLTCYRNEDEWPGMAAQWLQAREELLKPHKHITFPRSSEEAMLLLERLQHDTFSLARKADLKVVMLSGDVASALTAYLLSASFETDVLACLTLDPSMKHWELQNARFLAEYLGLPLLELDALGQQCSDPTKLPAFEALLEEALTSAGLRGSFVLFEGEHGDSARATECEHIRRARPLQGLSAAAVRRAAEVAGLPILEEKDLHGETLVEATLQDRVPEHPNHSNAAVLAYGNGKFTAGASGDSRLPDHPAQAAESEWQVAGMPLWDETGDPASQDMRRDLGNPVQKAESSLTSFWLSSIRGGAADGASPAKLSAHSRPKVEEAVDMAIKEAVSASAGLHH